MIWDVKLYVGGRVFTESVHATNREDALETAKARISETNFLFKPHWRKR